MYFDDGSDPYKNIVDQVTVLRATNTAHLIHLNSWYLIFIMFLYLYFNL